MEKISEWCPYCNQEVEIDRLGGNCSVCGEYLKPCSQCYNDYAMCDYCKEIENYHKVISRIIVGDEKVINGSKAVDIFYKSYENHYATIYFIDEKDVKEQIHKIVLKILEVEKWG